MTTTIDELLTVWVESERDADVRRLDTLLTDDFAGVGPVGFVLAKEAWLRRFELGLQYDRLELDEVATHRHGDTAFVVAHQRARGTVGPTPTPSDLRVSFTVVAGADAVPRIAGMQYSFIGMPEPAPVRGTVATPNYRPPLPLRIANRMLRRALTRGKGPSFMRLLTVAGRRSGEPRTTPVVPVRRDGEIWVVSPYGDVDWVRNVRVAGRLELARGEERVRYDAQELDAHDAIPVLRAYLSMPTERFVRSHFDITADSSDEAIAVEAPRHPVFALAPIR